MLKAYDTFLQSEITAEMAVKNNAVEPYRYECACCGEEVRLAAANSLSMVPHFRHRCGNNDIECEEYISKNSFLITNPSARKSRTEIAEIYFENNTKMLSFGVRFSELELSEYEKEPAYIMLSSTENGEPDCKLIINRTNFAPDEVTLIPIEKFAHKYYLSNSRTATRREYKVFHEKIGNAPLFFKVQGNDDNNRAKLVRSSTLYTNVRYFAMYQCQYSSPWTLCNVPIENSFEFTTMGKRFIGGFLTISDVNDSILDSLRYWGFNLEVNESLKILWPPIHFSNESYLLSSDFVYLYSSFELQPHVNINIHLKDVAILPKNIYRLSAKMKIKIYKKNAEMTISKDIVDAIPYDSLHIEEKKLKKFTVPDDGIYFRFCHSGVFRLCKGMSFSMTPNSEIRHFQQGYLYERITPSVSIASTGEQLLVDVIKHYKREEIFTWNDFNAIELTITASDYLEKCEKYGKINSAAKLLILEGRV